MLEINKVRYPLYKIRLILNEKEFIFNQPFDLEKCKVIFDTSIVDNSQLSSGKFILSDFKNQCLNDEFYIFIEELSKILMNYSVDNKTVDDWLRFKKENIPSEIKFIILIDNEETTINIFYNNMFLIDEGDLIMKFEHAVY